MTLEEFKDTTEKILANLGDQGEVTKHLADLTQGFSDEVSARSDTDAKLQQANAENNKLKEDNMSLFLRVSAEATGGASDKKVKNEHSIDSLFENGKIKWED